MGTKPLYVGGITISLLFGLILGTNCSTSQDCSAVEDDPGQAVEYAFSRDDILKYRVKSEAFTDQNGISTVYYSWEGLLEGKISCVDDDGSYQIDLGVVLLSAYARDINEPFIVDKNVKIEVSMQLTPHGDLEFDMDKLSLSMKKQGRLSAIYVQVFSAVGVIFPPLPRQWSGPAITGGDYSYNCTGAVTIKGEQRIGTKEHGVYMDLVSVFSEGMVKSGYINSRSFMKAKQVAHTQLRVSLISAPHQGAAEAAKRMRPK